jgi:hypothetical protein
MTTATQNDLLELGEATLLADVSRAELLEAIRTRRLPATPDRRAQAAEIRLQGGSWGSGTLRISRADLERYAGARFHGGHAQGGWDVLSLCETKICSRYARGHFCDEHGASSDPLARPLKRKERTAYHEASHAVTAKKLGWTIRSVSIVEDGGKKGELVADGPAATSLEAIRDELTVRLAGPIGGALAGREDWHTLKLDREREHEEPTRLYSCLAAQGARFGGDHQGAYEWVEQATASAGERAYELLERNWLDVAYLATRLLREGKVEYACPANR